MRMRLVLAMVVLVTFGVRSSSAQTTETLPYDHMHLAAADPAKAVEWYKAHMGATAGDLPDRVMVGRVIFVWQQRANSPTSEGSVVDHIGFSFPDIDAKIAELTAAGAKLVTPARDVQGLFKLAFIEDPFGTKIELVQDAETPGFHHIHLRLPDPDKALAWYSERFGGERAKLKGRIDGLRYTGGLWLLVQKADGAPPSSGRAIDHLGWRVRDVDATFVAAKTRGDKITAEPRPVRDLRVGFLEDPNGVRIEIVQRPQY
jgi:catechol 2,3-dioxygenase-like lactoylglutathione lyase family enzyme